MTTPVSEVAEVAAFAREHGLPIVINTASRGGGRGVSYEVITAPRYRLVMYRD
jgi:acetyl/propionyl-CoA carboxylase alpha subunit